jgi:PAS domain S-box-containing protein
MEKARLANGGGGSAVLRPELVGGASAPDPRDWLAAIIDGSDDAIVSKNLNGIIQSWNGGATRLFGYQPKDVIGRSVTILIPPDRLNEEPMILAEIQKGNRVDHFETKRRCKDGSLIDISLTISPIRNEAGKIVGASKIARDITGRLRAQEEQQLLIGEMHHRVKNLFALAKAIVSLSAKSRSGQGDVIAEIQARLTSLARAHELILSDRSRGPDAGRVHLIALLQTILAPYAVADRIRIGGDDCEVGGKAVTNLALLLHEMATNAAKHGSLSVDEGRIHIEILSADDRVHVVWGEAGGPTPIGGKSAGFGSRLEQGLSAALGATITRDWQHTGLVISISLDKAMLS